METLLMPYSLLFRRLLLMLLLTSSGAQADVLLLAHGWASNADTWRQSGVVNVLRATGWRDAGVLQATPGGIALIPTPFPPADHTLYLAQLPAAAPLSLQADLLAAQLAFIRQRHPHQRLILAGHSAGAVVARLALVTRQPAAVDTLISIAGPNLGTLRAVQGLQVVDERPFFCPGPGVDLVKQIFGGDDYRYLRDSRPALLDMTPHALALWLNQQPHPAINYLAIVHQLPGSSGDDLVPAFSQDLNQVAALQGRAQTMVVTAPHALSSLDGQLIARFLAKGSHTRQ